MKKFISSAILGIFLICSLNAYDATTGAESLYSLSSAKNLAGITSVAGGAFLSETQSADSIVVNPALQASEQRTSLNLGYTGLVSNYSLNSVKYGSAIQAGILWPTKMFVLTGLVNADFIPFYEVNLKNSLTAHVGLSKEITKQLNIGLSVDGGLLWDSKTDWCLTGNLGFTYDMGQISFLPDVKIGVSLMNLGKTFNLVLPGYENKNFILNKPTFATLKAGASTTIFQNENMEVGAYLDIMTPCFQNVEFNLGAGLSIKDMFFVNVAEKINVYEVAQKKGSFIPSVNIGFKFNLNLNNVQYLEKNGWSNSEIQANASYKNICSTVNAVSLDADVYLGMQDKTPPVIMLWDGDEED